MMDGRQTTIAALDGAMPDAAEVEPVERQRLSPAERQQLETCEAIIGASFETQGAAILAARSIREQKLWREDHESFDAYCRARWQKSQVRVNELIRAAEVQQNIASSVERNSVSNGAERAAAERNSVPLLPNPAQAVHLAKLGGPAEQRDAWKEALDEAAAADQPVTAKAVEEVVKKRQLVAGLPEEERRQALALVSEPGWPADRAELALKTIAQMEPEERKETLSQAQSHDTRERSRAISKVVRNSPPADPRRLTLEVFVPEIDRCAGLFPDDPVTPDLNRLAADTRRVIQAIRRQEEEKQNGTEAT